MNSKQDLIEFIMEYNKERVSERVDQFYELLNALATYYNLSREDMLEILFHLESKWKY